MLRKEQVSEIKRMYRESKDKKKQIGILADLNACTKEEIREVLGMKAPGPQPEKVVDTKVKRAKSGRYRCHRTGVTVGFG